MHLYIYFWSEIFIYLCTYFLSAAIEAEAIASVLEQAQQIFAVFNKMIEIP